MRRERKKGVLSSFTPPGKGGALNEVRRGGASLLALYLE